MNDVNCPYCDAEVEINHDDGYGYGENKIYNQECPNCEKIFTYTTSIHFSYEAQQADCLNGAEHNFQLTNTFPRKYAKMECKTCGETRELTDEERQELNLESIPS